MSDVSNHIQVFQEGEYIVVRADDFELFDWLDDLMTEEHNIEYELVRWPDHDSCRQLQRLFVPPPTPQYQAIDEHCTPELVSQSERVSAAGTRPRDSE